MPTGAKPGDPWILKLATDPRILKIREKHISYDNYDQLVKDWVDDKLIMYQSSVNLKATIRRSLINE